MWREPCHRAPAAGFLWELVRGPNLPNNGAQDTLLLSLSFISRLYLTRVEKHHPWPVQSLLPAFRKTALASGSMEDQWRQGQGGVRRSAHPSPCYHHPGSIHSSLTHPWPRPPQPAVFLPSLVLGLSMLHPNPRATGISLCFFGGDIPFRVSMATQHELGSHKTGGRGAQRGIKCIYFKHRHTLASLSYYLRTLVFCLIFKAIP